MQSPSSGRGPASAAGGDAGYIHAFGYHLAKKMLGTSPVDDCVRAAYQAQVDHPNEAPFHCHRANWRSAVRYPWQLPKADGAGDRKGGDVRPETLFVDVTFDFNLFPVEVVTEGRTKSCHVVRMEDLYQGDANMVGEANSIAIAVALRVGALVAVPNQGSTECDGYQYFYIRGNDALAVSDIDEHCRGIDIIREEMDSAAIAGIVGDAFLEGSKEWQVVGIRQSGGSGTAVRSLDLTTIDNGPVSQPKERMAWQLKLHHKALEADGILPLSSCSSIDSAESIGRCVLDTILLQSNVGGSGAECISVPANEARKLWQTIDPALMRAVERPVEPSPQKMSPARSIALAAAVAAEEEKRATAEKISKPKAAARRPPPRPQENAIYVKGRQRGRKKQKFTLGPA